MSLYFNSQVLKGPSGIASAHPALRNSIIAVDPNVDSNVESQKDLREVKIAAPPPTAPPPTPPTPPTTPTALSRGHHPSDVPHKLAIIVPFRDDGGNDPLAQGIGREQNLNDFNKHMCNFVKVPMDIYVVEQEQGTTWNKGKLFNIGYHLTKRDHDYMCSTMSIKCRKKKKTITPGKKSPHCCCPRPHNGTISEKTQTLSEGRCKYRMWIMPLWVATQMYLRGGAVRTTTWVIVSNNTWDTTSWLPPLDVTRN